MIDFIFEKRKKKSTLLILMENVDDLNELRAIFESLYSKKVLKVIVQAQANFRNLKALDINCSVTEKKNVEVKLNESPEIFFISWSGDKEHWNYCYDLLNHFLIKDEKGHQYLTQLETTNIDVVASFKEKDFYFSK